MNLLGVTPPSPTTATNVTARKGFFTRQSMMLGLTRRHAATLLRATTTRMPVPSSLQPLSMMDFQKQMKLPDVNADYELQIRNVKDVSYVSRRRLDSADFDPNEVDEDGLPLVYNEQRIADYWKNKPGELTSRWTRFAAISAPWLTSLANAVIQGKLVERQAVLARDAVDNLEKLGPTFVKLGQILSIRPDVLPPPVMAELARLQDKIRPFDTAQARSMVEKELGSPIDVIFSEFSPSPIAAASLAQVYRARLRETGEEVAVKVQRPGAIGIVSKDLYVMRRGVGVYESLVKRFTAQTTDYQLLLSTFAEGLYTELDFRNEALNGIRMQQLLDESEFSTADIVIPKPILKHTTRRVLTMEWITGVKLTTLDPAEIRGLIRIGQEAFLTQLLQIGFFHGDPHPGNLLKVTQGPNTGKLALLDFGLVAEIPVRDRAAMMSSVIHLSNQDWDALITDFQELNFLPRTADRGRIIPIMQQVLGPYLKGGGAKNYNFAALSQDLLGAAMQIEFSVPPYMSLLARSVATLEGLALTGDKDYQMIAQAYPFVVRKVLRNEDAGASTLLRDILYDAEGNVKPTRMSALLNAALGYVADQTDGFIDFDAVPADGASVKEILAFLLSPEARDLRPLLTRELTNFGDLLLRDRARRAYAALPTLRPWGWPSFLPSLPTLPLPPMFVPGLGFTAVEEVVDLLAPKLTAAEQVYLQSLTELSASLLGVKAANVDSTNGLVALFASPTQQAKDLYQALLGISGDATSGQTIASIVADVAEGMADRQAARAGVPADTLFPLLTTVRPMLAQLTSGNGRGALTSAGSGSPASSFPTASRSSSSGSVGAISNSSLLNGRRHVHRDADARYDAGTGAASAHVDIPAQPLRTSSSSFTGTQQQPAGAQANGSVLAAPASPTNGETVQVLGRSRALPTTGSQQKTTKMTKLEWRGAPSVSNDSQNRFTVVIREREAQLAGAR